VTVRAKGPQKDSRFEKRIEKRIAPCSRHGEYLTAEKKGGRYVKAGMKFARQFTSTTSRRTCSRTRRDSFGQWYLGGIALIAPFGLAWNRGWIAHNQRLSLAGSAPQFWLETGAEDRFV
jgi:hypothetical protein